MAAGHHLLTDIERPQVNLSNGMPPELETSQEGIDITQLFYATLT